MERGLHYQAWYRGDWNYHPSLPPKRLQMVEDIVDLKGTCVIWPCLGSAGMGLPYLYREAFDKIDPRFRFNGYINDSEFISECKKRGITVYAVLFKAHLWDFPVELNEDETEILSLNITRGTGQKKRLGIRELSMDRYPKIFKSMNEFFPEGLKDSDGNLIRDYLAGFQSVTLEGRKPYSKWLMVPGKDQYCYSPCPSKRGFQEYMKKAVEIMIDAGANGIILDEPEQNKNNLDYGGCFCRDCVKGFNEWLRRNPGRNTLGINPDCFDYGEYLRKRGYEDKDLALESHPERMKIPLYRSWFEYGLEIMAKSNREYFEHARSYASQKGVDIKLTANIYNCFAYTAGYTWGIDLICGEYIRQELRQDGFYRFVRGYANGRPTCLSEAPNEYFVKMLEEIKGGKNDRYILYMLEPFAQGVGMSVPYGAWMIHLVKDSLWPDMELARAMGEWLENNERMADSPVSDVALVYDQRAMNEEELFRHNIFEWVSSFHRLTMHLCRNHRLFEVVYLSPWMPLLPERIDKYKTIIVCDAYLLPDDDRRAIKDWIAGGGRCITVSRCHSDFLKLKHFDSPEDQGIIDLLQEERQIADTDGPREIGFTVHKIREGYALHLVNYRMDEENGKVAELDEIRFQLMFAPKEFEVIPFGKSGAKAQINGCELTVTNLGVYTIIKLVTGQESDTA